MKNGEAIAQGCTCMKGEVTDNTGDKASHIVLGMFHLVQDQYSVPRCDHDYVSNYILSRDFEEI